MDKKKKRLIIALIAILVILIYLIGSIVYAKYILSAEGIGSADIAGFRINFQGQNLDSLEDGSIGSFTIGPENSITTDLVKADKMAPGSQLGFNIRLNGYGSDVAIKYTLEFLDVQKPQNMYFKIATREDIYNSLEEVGEALSGICKATGDDRKIMINKTVHCIWDYETGSSEEERAENNAKDTQDAIEGRNLSFKIRVTCEQASEQDIQGA